MKKLTILKALVLSLMVAVCSVMPLHAQTDGFFRGGSNDNYSNRDEISSPGNDTNGISNYGIGENDSPLGNGLLIMVAAGAGYAVARRKRSRRDASHASKGTMIILAVALLLGLTQCKKNVETITEASTGMHITLTIDDGSKVIVNPHGHANPNYATVTFEEGDVIYVGHNQKYVGQLTCDASGVFSGTIDDGDLTTNDYFHFYFMGNKTPRSQSETSITVDIIDQTAEYPVISYAHSTQKYESGKTSYVAKLRNYCSIMKFTTTDIGANKAVKIKGMKNRVTVDFGKNFGDGAVENPYSYDKIDEGIIIMHTETATERWAIVLPNSEGVTATATAAGWGATATQPNLNKVSIPAIGINEYKDNGGAGYPINLAANGMIDGKISVSPTKQVYFCSGNVQYQASTDTWRFAENQWDYVGDATNGNVYENNVKSSNTSIAYNYTGWIDLFGWATSGWDNTGGENPGETNDPKAANWQPWATEQNIYYVNGKADRFNPTHYGPTWDSINHYHPYPNESLNSNVIEGMTGTNYDWGYYHTTGGGSVITNSGGYEWRACQWREGCFFGGDSYNGGFDPLTLIGKRVKEIGGNYVPLIGFGTVNGVDGLIILPDKWDGTFDPNFSYYNPYDKKIYNETTSSPRWSAMEAYGVAFFPCAGYRDGTTVTYAGERGGYWSSDPAIYGNRGIILHDETWTVDPDTEHLLRGDAFVLKINEPGTDAYWMDYRYRGFSVRLYHEIN